MKTRFILGSALAAVLLMWGGTGKVMAQKNIDKMAAELEKRDDVAINSVTKRDPKTRKVVKVVKSFSLKDENIGARLIEAFEKDEEYAETAIKDMPKGRGKAQKANFTFIYKTDNEKRTYTLNVKESGSVSMTVIISPMKDGQEVCSVVLDSEYWDSFNEQMAELGNNLRVQAAVRTGYMQQILAGYLQDYIQQERSHAQMAQASTSSFTPSFQIIPVTKMLYNPQSRSEYNFVPGVIGLILLLICAMMTSIAIVKEKEMGTMEILLASPLPPIVIVVAKLVPYFVISCMNLATILLLSVFLLNIPIAGSVMGFIAISLLYILVSLLLGLFISNCVSSQLAAMLLSLLLIVPTVYLSGLVFPIESMPEALQNASAIIPARWYVEVARKLMIQGVEMKYVMHETAVLALMAVVLLGVSWKLFKVRL